MDFQIKQCAFEFIREKLMEHLNSLLSLVDSFLEERISEANCYDISVNDQSVGFFCIYKSNTLTQFFLEKAYRKDSQMLFTQIKKYEHLQYAFVPTCDEFYLAHGLDECKRLEMQAYFFQDCRCEGSSEKIVTEFSIRKALTEDGPMIKEKSGDFFDHLEQRIARGDIYIGWLGEIAVAFGIITKSALYPNVASIGMFVVEEYRKQGLGKNMLLNLKKNCYALGLVPIAGCWYYNHNSKKTLQSAGLYSFTRLLKVSL